MPVTPHDIEPPIGVDDATIARMIEGASMPALMMAVVHMTGDTTLLDGAVRPPRLRIHDVRGRMRPEDEAFLKERAIDAIRAWRQRGWTLPPLARDTIRRMMNVCTGQAIPDEYVDLLVEEMGLAPAAAAPAPRPGWRVLVIGAGMSGIAAASRLIEAGHEVVVVERNPSVGGTWFENRYPGCRVDVPNHFYSYSFLPNHGWRKYFAPQPDLLAYFKDAAEACGIDKLIRLSTEVTGASWLAEDSLWEAELRCPDGTTERLRVNAIVSAVGLFNQPKLPDIEGMESFAGRSFHSARWPDDLDLAGKRVAVIGSGASAFQLVPELAKTAAQVSVFQRTPGWMLPNPDYYADVDDDTVWCLRHLPFYARWYRFMLFWASSDALLPALKLDPAWPDPDRSLNALSERLRVQLTAGLREQTGGDETLFQKLLPDYPPFGKRPLIDNGAWVRALRSDTVELVTEPIERIVPAGVLDATGKCHDVDVIVYATGFHAGRFLHPLSIIGRDGRDLRELWGDEPRAFLGIAMPGFPNFFCLYGPGTNFGHGGSIIFLAECQIRFILSALDRAHGENAGSIEIRQDANDAYRARLETELAAMVWSRPNVGTYYKNTRGIVTTTMPFRIVDYWRWTKEAPAGDFLYDGAPHPGAPADPAAEWTFPSAAALDSNR
jgi:4-hydroxyacetophenone monooxygenase